MNAQPIVRDQHRLGIREASLLLIAAAFALLMMDFGKGALVACCAVVALWLWAAIRGPRPSPMLTIVYGAGIFVTCFWWPREGWWPIAVGLTWLGLALVIGGLILILTIRLRKA